MSRRGLFAKLLAAIPGLSFASLYEEAANAASPATDPNWQLSDATWKSRLSPAAYAVLRQERVLSAPSPAP